MKCVHCNENDMVLQFSEETFPCPDCDSKVVIGYHACSNCGYAWKTCNGEIIGDSTMNLEDIIPNNTDNFFSETEEEAVENSMEDYIHRCLQCNSVCYQEGESLYKCPSCDFEWEVIKSG